MAQIFMQIASCNGNVYVGTRCKLIIRFWLYRRVDRSSCQMLVHLRITHYAVRELILWNLATWIFIQVVSCGNDIFCIVKLACILENRHKYPVHCFVLDFQIIYLTNKHNIYACNLQPKALTVFSGAHIKRRRRFCPYC